MKVRIEAERKVFLALVIEAESLELATEAALRAPRDAWDTDDDEEVTITYAAPAPEEEAFWRASESGEIEPYEEGGAS
jgi:hypothetical protein